MYIHVYTSDFDYVSSDVYILYIFIKLHVYNYVCTYVRMYACMCVCMCISTYNTYVWPHICIWNHMNVYGVSVENATHNSIKKIQEMDVWVSTVVGPVPGRFQLRKSGRLPPPNVKATGGSNTSKRSQLVREESLGTSSKCWIWLEKWKRPKSGV